MKDNGNQPHPVRTLTVKNFSVIKEAKLEFGKITVLIGPQASGKSLLCKLAYFLGREVINVAIDRAVNRFEYGFSDFEVAAQNEFSKWFPRGGWGTDNWSINFSTNKYEVTVSAPTTAELKDEPRITFCPAFETAYSARVNATIEHQKSGGLLIAQALQSLAATELLKPLGRGVWDNSTYIPLERSYFIDTKRGYRVLGTETDPISANFAVVFADSLNSRVSRPRVSKYLDGDLVSWQEGWSLAFHDGRFLPLSHLSSGGKESLPMLSVLDYYESRRRQSGNLKLEELYGNRLYFFDDFTIEEPEASVFPHMQNELMRELAAMANEVNCEPHFTITTHSPYILTSFNNLIEAGQAARNNPTLKGEIAKIIPEQYWIKDGEFKAYAIEDGKLKSILNESGFIEGNYLDQVSEVIGNEFDALLRLEYDHTKAS